MRFYPLEKVTDFNPVRKQSSLTGFTLIEILVSMTILALIMAGMVGLFTASRRHVVRSRSRMVQGELGRYFLDPLQMHVDQSDWDGTSDDYIIANPLHKRTDEEEASINLDGIDYTPTYTVDTPPGFPLDSAMRKVVLTISYPSYD